MLIRILFSDNRQVNKNSTMGGQEENTTTQEKVSVPQFEKFLDTWKNSIKPINEQIHKCKLEIKDLKKTEGRRPAIRYELCKKNEKSRQ